MLFPQAGPDSTQDAWLLPTGEPDAFPLGPPAPLGHGPGSAGGSRAAQPPLLALGACSPAGETPCPRAGQLGGRGARPPLDLSWHSPAQEPSSVLSVLCCQMVEAPWPLPLAGPTRGPRPTCLLPGFPGRRGDPSEPLSWIIPAKLPEGSPESCSHEHQPASAHSRPAQTPRRRTGVGTCGRVSLGTCSSGSPGDRPPQSRPLTSPTTSALGQQGPSAFVTAGPARKPPA